MPPLGATRMVGPASFLAGDEAMRVDDAGAMFAAPHAAAERNGLAKGQKGMARKAARNDSVPEGQNIDPTVRTTTDRVMRHSD